MDKLWYSHTVEQCWGAKRNRLQIQASEWIKSQKHYAEWNKPDIKVCIQFDSMYMIFWKCRTLERNHHLPRTRSKQRKLTMEGLWERATWLYMLVKMHQTWGKFLLYIKLNLSKPDLKKEESLVPQHSKEGEGKGLEGVIRSCRNRRYSALSEALRDAWNDCINFPLPGCELEKCRDLWNSSVLPKRIWFSAVSTGLLRHCV